MSTKTKTYKNISIACLSLMGFFYIVTMIDQTPQEAQAKVRISPSAIKEVIQADPILGQEAEIVVPQAEVKPEPKPEPVVVSTARNWSAVPRVADAVNKSATNANALTLYNTMRSSEVGGDIGHVDAMKMVAICYHESYDWTSQPAHAFNSDGSRDYGICQVNSYWYCQKSRPDLLLGASPDNNCSDNLLNPAINAKVAKYILTGNGKGQRNYHKWYANNQKGYKITDLDFSNS